MNTCLNCQIIQTKPTVEQKVTDTVGGGLSDSHCCMIESEVTICVYGTSFELSEFFKGEGIKQNKTEQKKKSS